MRIGFLEIGIILAVVMVFFGISRLSKAGSGNNQKYVRYTPEEEASIRERRLALIAAQEAEDEIIRKKRRSSARMIGLVLIGLGILAIFYLLFIIKWVATSPLWIWGVVVVFIGAVIVYSARGK
ncbi:MAG: hypothetical protein WC958_04740 [Dehalococcoidales bacterium]